MAPRLQTVALIAGKTVAVLAVVWALTCCAIYWVMRQPPEKFASVMAKIPEPIAFVVFPFETLWMHARVGTLNVGDPAPNFTLDRLDHSARVQLSSFQAQHRPVVLIFGSYT